MGLEIEESAFVCQLRLSPEPRLAIQDPRNEVTVAWNDDEVGETGDLALSKSKPKFIPTGKAAYAGTSIAFTYTCGSDYRCHSRYWPQRK